MTQLDNIQRCRPLVKFPARCGSASLRRSQKYSANSEEIPHTFLSALEWVDRHDVMLRKFVSLMEQFPKLMDDSDLNYFRLFLTQHYQSKVNAEQEKAIARILESPHARRVPSSYSLLSPGKIEVYISGEVDESQWTNTDFIARELSQHFKIQSDPPLPRFPGFLAEEEMVLSCNVLVFVMTGTSLSDAYCLHQLRTAVSHHVPVLIIREPEGVEIPKSIQECEEPIHLTRPVTALSDMADQTPVLFLDDTTKPIGKDENRGVNKSLDRINRCKTTEPQTSIYLRDWLKKEIPSAMLFSFDHRATCMSKIVTRVKNIALGETFVDGFGKAIPTELPASPEQIERLPPSFKNAKIADMAQSLQSHPTASLWGGTPNCGRCGQHFQLPDRMSINTPSPGDPTLTKFLHHSQKQLTMLSQTDPRPHTAPSSMRYSGWKDSKSRGNSRSGKSIIDPSQTSDRKEEKTGSRPASARSVTFSDTDQVVQFEDDDEEQDEGDD